MPTEALASILSCSSASPASATLRAAPVEVSRLTTSDRASVSATWTSSCLQRLGEPRLGAMVRGGAGDRVHAARVALLPAPELPGLESVKEALAAPRPGVV